MLASDMAAGSSFIDDQTGKLVYTVERRLDDTVENGDVIVRALVRYAADGGTDVREWYADQDIPLQAGVSEV